MTRQLDLSSGITRDCCRLACQSVTTEIHQFSESLGKAIDAKDHHTSQHSEQVAVLAHTLALGMGLPPNQADHIHIAGHLHDIGKIGVPDSILRKAGPLSEREWQEIKRHPQVGADIIAPVHFLRSNGIVEMVLHHHESYDGEGYPHGLAGKAIPLGARIIAVADSLSSMLEHRPYRPKQPLNRAIADITGLSGVRYDPEVISVMLRDMEFISQVLGGLTLLDDQDRLAADPAGCTGAALRRGA